MLLRNGKNTDTYKLEFNSVRTLVRTLFLKYYNPKWDDDSDDEVIQPFKGYFPEVPTGILIEF